MIPLEIVISMIFMNKKSPDSPGSAIQVFIGTPTSLINLNYQNQLPSCAILVLRFPQHVLNPNQQCIPYHDPPWLFFRLQKIDQCNIGPLKKESMQLNRKVNIKVPVIINYL